MLEKFKEKKKNVVDALSGAIDASIITVRLILLVMCHIHVIVMTIIVFVMSKTVIFISKPVISMSFYHHFTHHFFPFTHHFLLSSLLSALLFPSQSPLSSNLEDLTTAMLHKNPSVRKESTLSALRFLQTTRHPPTKPDIKPLADTCIKLMDDSDPDVRDAAAEVIGTMMRLVGERAMAVFVEGLDKVRGEKVRAAYEGAKVAVAVKGAVVAKVREIC